MYFFFTAIGFVGQYYNGQPVSIAASLYGLTADDKSTMIVKRFVLFMFPFNRF